MAISSYPTASDPVIGTNDPMFANTWDQVHIDTETALELEHTDGSHISNDTATGGACVVESGTYVGDGNDDVTITLAESNLDILFLQVWRGEETWATKGFCLRSDTMTGDITKSLNAVFAANYIQSLGTGSFQIGSDDIINAVGINYYYTAYGVISSIPSGDGKAFEPSWVQHGEAIDTTLQQRVPAAILSRFRFSHEDDGTHQTPLLKIAIGSYTGDGQADGPEVTPSPAITTIKRLVIWASNTQYPVLKTDQMADGDCTNFSTNWYTTDLEFTTGSTFHVITSAAHLNTNALTYYYVAFGV